MPPPDESDRSARSGDMPVRPWGPPAGGVADAAQPFQPAARRKIPLLSILFFVLLISGVLIQAWQELSTPGAWELWKDSYLSSSLKATVVEPAPSGLDSRTVLAISGRIGPAAASWFREELNDTKLRAGDTVAFSSPGGSVDQAIIIGEEIRLRGLKTVVATFDADGRMRSSYCASACVLAYAGGVARFGVNGSTLGVHRFTSKGESRDPVAETQRTTGLILGYMTRMGVASSFLEAMSATDDIRWLTPQQAADMKLVTAPLAQR
jgi:hypothetical protein